MILLKAPQFPVFDSLENQKSPKFRAFCCFLWKFL